MTKRWLAGLAIFALGFGSAHVMRVATADAGGGGMMDEGLFFVEHPDRFEVVNTGTHDFLLIVDRKAGTGIIEPETASATGSASVFKEGLNKLIVARIQSIGELKLVQPPFRECRPDFQDCFGPDPILPPRPPRKSIFLGPQGM